MPRAYHFLVPESLLDWLGRQASDRGLSIAAYLRLLILDAKRRSEGL
jgi:hypothetical protein